MASFSRVRRRLLITALVLTVLALAGALLRTTIRTHLRAVSVLLLTSNPKSTSVAARFARLPLREESGITQTPHGALRYRLYTPSNVSRPGGLVLLHGVHHLNIEDHRIIDLARAMAGAGVVVMTPEIEDLANYRVTPECIDVIADSAALLSSRMGHAPVGVVGLSFAGGLALMAASRPGSEKEIGYVLAVGAHDDMARVSRFFATSVIEKPGGDSAPLQPHEYGALLLAYAHLEDFFTPKDLPVAHEALRQWLWEQRDDAMKTSATLSPQGQARFDAILHHRDQLQGILLREILKHQDELDAVSPHDKLKDLHIPVYLLHGAGDNIIPASETLWLARDVPQPELRAVLVSTALTHVDMRKSVPWSEQWALISFMAQVLRATDHLADLGQTAGPSSGSN